MAKKKGRSVTTKNRELLGGKNSLPKTNTGKVDVSKMTQEAPKRKAMTHVEKAGVKPKTQPKQEIAKKPVSGISKLKSSVTKKQAPVPNKQVAKSQPAATPKAKGVSKLKAATPKAKPKTVKAPTKKGPSKGR